MCLCSLLTSAVYYIRSVCYADAKHYMGMGLLADNDRSCLCNRNSSKPSPSVFAQAEVLLPAQSAALRNVLQKPTPVQNCTRLSAHLQKWRGISVVYPGLCAGTVFTVDAETLRRQEKIMGGEAEDQKWE